MADINALIAAIQNQAPAGKDGSAAKGYSSASGLPLSLPQPTTSGSLDMSSIRPAHTGNTSLADAIARAKDIAIEKQREDTRSRSPPRRESYRDNRNPFRDERRDDPRRGAARERSMSPVNKQDYSPARNQTRTRSPPAKSDTSSEVITVDSSTVGLIIGRGGENLKRVETESGARVQFITGPEAGPKRQCRISGTRRQREDAIRDIYRIIEEHPGSVPEKVQAATPVSVPQTGSNGREENIQIMVPDRTVGLIIGRGGETIRDIQERSSCHVNITGENKSVNGLRPVNLIGPRQACDEARKLIMEVVDSDTRAAPPPAGYQHQALPPQYGAPPPQYGMSYDPYGGAAYDPNASSRMTDTMIVPSEAVGMIIGKGGETIKDMQNMTGCKINVSPPSGADINREIGLIGSRGAIEQAKRAIWDKREKQGGVWTRGGEVAPSYPDPYAHQPPAYGQPPVPQPASVPPPDAGDPYAAYGGYAAYYALWAAAMANQQH